jgi:putative heme transporter
VIAVFLLATVGGRSPVLATAAFVGAAVLGVAIGVLVAILWSGRTATAMGDLAARVADRIGRRLGRDPVLWGGENFDRFRLDAADLLRRRWHVLTVVTYVGTLTVFLVLLVALRACGVSAEEVSLPEAFAAWSLARILGTFPITPGGIGIVELGLSGALVGFGGDNAGVVAAVLVYRFLTMAPTIALGLVSAATAARMSPASRSRSEAASPDPASAGSTPTGPPEG